jgi:hypothetical protein
MDEDDFWHVVDGVDGWLVRGQLMVRIGRWGALDAGPEFLHEDPAETVRVLVELLAHGEDDVSLGALVRRLLEPMQETGVGSWKWTGRVKTTTPVDTTFF